jgi:hypothetical protein
LVKSYFWLTLASSRNYQVAEKLRAEISSKMSLAQIAEAHKLSAEWHPKAQVPSLAQKTSDYAEAKGPGALFWICNFAVIILVIASNWKVFSKAGQPGWAAIIPIYNVYVMCKVAGRPGWWLLLFLIPLVNFIIAIILNVDVAKRFGKGVGFAIGMIFLSFIFWPILGFGSAQYQGGAPSIPTT